jgi:hypothetical protein
MENSSSNTALPPSRRAPPNPRRKVLSAMVRPRLYSLGSSSTTSVTPTSDQVSCVFDTGQFGNRL